MRIVVRPYYTLSSKQVRLAKDISRAGIASLRDVVEKMTAGKDITEWKEKLYRAERIDVDSKNYGNIDDD
jgi:hypothetical protein